eukprot:2638983-Lingulodinium_polyedra.AAC.2
MHQVQEEEPTVAAIVGVNQSMVGGASSRFVGQPWDGLGCPPSCLWPKVSERAVGLAPVAEAFAARLQTIVVRPPELVAPSNELPSAAANLGHGSTAQETTSQCIKVLDDAPPDHTICMPIFFEVRANEEFGEFLSALPQQRRPRDATAAQRLRAGASIRVHSAGHSASQVRWGFVGQERVASSPNCVLRLLEKLSPEPPAFLWVGPEPEAELPLVLLASHADQSRGQTEPLHATPLQLREQTADADVVANAHQTSIRPLAAPCSCLANAFHHGVREAILGCIAH